MAEMNLRRLVGKCGINWTNSLYELAKISPFGSILLVIGEVWRLASMQVVGKIFAFLGL